jgi:hypothetical protein
MGHLPLDSAPRALWTALLAFLPVCPGCGAVLCDSVTAADEFCVACLERSRESTRDELGGEA